MHVDQAKLQREHFVRQYVFEPRGEPCVHEEHQRRLPRRGGQLQLAQQELPDFEDVAGFVGEL